MRGIRDSAGDSSFSPSYLDILSTLKNFCTSIIDISTLSTLVWVDLSVETWLSLLQPADAAKQSIVKQIRKMCFTFPQSTLWEVQLMLYLPQLLL